MEEKTSNSSETDPRVGVSGRRRLTLPSVRDEPIVTVPLERGATRSDSGPVDTGTADPDGDRVDVSLVSPTARVDPGRVLLSM